MSPQGAILACEPPEYPHAPNFFLWGSLVQRRLVHRFSRDEARIFKGRKIRRARDLHKPRMEPTAAWVGEPR